MWEPNDLLRVALRSVPLHRLRFPILSSACARARAEQCQGRDWHAMDHGVVQMTGDRRAVAVWLPRDRPLPQIPDYDTRLRAACERYTERFRELDAAFDKHHPTEAHHHLALLAVDPDRQGRGLGSALLHSYHADLDAAGIPAYLEASSPASRRLYRRHGYAERGDPIDLPYGGPRLWPMWRKPRPPRPLLR